MKDITCKFAHFFSSTLFFTFTVNLTIAQTILPSQIISSDRTLSKSGSPYIVNGNILIQNARLTIEPGTTIKFKSNYYFDIQSGGSVFSSGLQSDSILFTSDSSNSSGRFYFRGGSSGSIVTNDTTYQSGSFFRYTKFDNLGKVVPSASDSYIANIIHNVDLFFDKCTFNNLEGSYSYPYAYNAVSVNIGSKGYFNQCLFSNIKSSIALLGWYGSNLGNKIFRSNFINIQNNPALGYGIFGTKLYLEDCNFENIKSNKIFDSWDYSSRASFLTVKNTNFKNLETTGQFINSDNKVVKFDGCSFYNIKSGETFMTSKLSQFEVTGSSISLINGSTYLFSGDSVKISNTNISINNNQKVGKASGTSNINNPGITMNLSNNYWRYGKTIILDSVLLHDLSLGNRQDVTLDKIQFSPISSILANQVQFNNPPQSYDTTFSIKDSISINDKVGKIRSLDTDVDVLTFKIKSGNINETFKLDSLGNVYVKNKIIYDLSNKYELLISVSDGFDSTTSKVTINIAPIPAFYYTGNFGVCTGDSLRVTTNKYAGYSILWYKNGALFNNTNSDTVYLKEANNYQIKIVKGVDTIASVIKTFVINTIPSSPVASAKNLCQNETGVSLSAIATSGNSLIWYGTNATGGSSSTTAPIISTSSTGNADYYVSQKNTTTGCESPRTKLSVTINPLPVSPTVRDTAFCQNSTSIVLSAGASSGNSLLWYGPNATGGSSNINATVPVTSAIGSYSYYVSQKNTTTGCESTRSKIGVTINPLPLAPIVRDTAYCNNENADTLRFNALSGTLLLWYGTNATGGTGSLTAIKPSTSTVGTVNYYISQIITTTGCIGPRSKVVVTIKPIPSAPTLSRDTANFLISGATSITWYKDGTALTDTAQKIKPTTPGSYTAKTTQNGCTSALSNPYYFLVTDLIKLSADEFIKLAPNPFINQINLDFVIKGYQRLNLEVFDLATGIRKSSMQNLTPGIPIYLGQLSTGTYYVRVSSKDGKINYQFKMIKL